MLRVRAQNSSSERLSFRVGPEWRRGPAKVTDSGWQQQDLVGSGAQPGAPPFCHPPILLAALHPRVLRWH